MAFRDKLVKAPLAFTFHDFIILPGYSKVEPSQVNLETRVTKKRVLKLK